MRFHADLHIHSKYSRATSRDLDLEHLAWWAALKGIAVAATGDCVHPQWLAELKEKLVPAEPGVFRLKPEIEAEVAATLPPSCRGSAEAGGGLPRFMLSTEISTIYKKGDKTRKIHHLIYAPDFASVDRLAAKLASIGNIASDGRPILGLDSRDLLEIALDSGPHSYLVPAHIWTPWFAALGSQSGFDSIEECYGDLANHIFAVETGLSSDPAMNWRISFLDRYRLTSNSDAHSPGKLGREATFFDCEPDYFAIRRALETGDGYGGTVEFFPEEGKYHADGHRKCRVRMSPKETLAEAGRCPVCGGVLTIGVLHRVEALADRDEAAVTPPATAGEVKSLVPLPEIVSEILGVGPGSKRVAHSYNQALARLGPELSILEEQPLEDISRVGSPLLGEAVARLRAGAVVREAGYDGEYGVIRLFEDGELATLRGGDLLFDAPVKKRPPPPFRGRAGEGGSSAEHGVNRPSRDAGSQAKEQQPEHDTSPPSLILPRKGAGDSLSALDADQRAAASHVEGPLLVVAGPGSGKTRMLTHRIAHLIAEHGAPAESCLAITFTRRAANEMRERLAKLVPEQAGRVPVHTFHSLGLTLLRENLEAAGLTSGFRVASETERTTALAAALDVSESKARKLLRRISKVKRGAGDAIDERLATAIAAYSAVLTTQNWVDFDDLVTLAAEALNRDTGFAERVRARLRFVSVDEFQDVDAGQYRLLRLIAPPGADLCVIGDPNQAIYSFRGADASAFELLARDDPAAASMTLRRNYRSSGTIVSAASQIIAQARESAPLAEIVRDFHERIAIHAAPTDRAEAEFIVAEIERLIGGHSFFSLDSGRSSAESARTLSFADFAVLYRTEAQSAALVEALERSGMPFKTSAHDRLTNAALTEGAERARERTLEEIALREDIEVFDPRADRIALLTMHAAKGLEFPVVFIVGLEEGVVPLRFGAPDPDDEAEERRLFYVAMTRAQDMLFLTRAKQRMWRGRLQALNASPFLADIEEELLQLEHREMPRRRDAELQLPLL